MNETEEGVLFHGLAVLICYLLPFVGENHAADFAFCAGNLPVTVHGAVEAAGQKPPPAVNTVSG